MSKKKLEIGVVESTGSIVVASGWERDADCVVHFPKGTTRKEVADKFPGEELVGLELIPEE